MHSFGLVGPLGGPELFLILAIGTLLFGAKRLPELARGFGKSLREFKRAVNEVDEPAGKPVEPAPAPPITETKAEK